MSMMVSFVLSFFPRDVLDEILNLIESVSEDFPSYSYATSHLSVKKYTLMEMSDLLYNRTCKPSVVIKQTAVNLTMI